MSQQSLNKVVISAVFAQVATALYTIIVVFTPSRRRLFMPRV